MEKIEIKLNDTLAEKGLSFYDPDSKKDIKHEKGKTLIVEKTPFVTSKIQSGEILVVNANPSVSQDASRVSQDASRVSQDTTRVSQDTTRVSQDIYPDKPKKS